MKSQDIQQIDQYEDHRLPTVEILYHCKFHVQMKLVDSRSFLHPALYAMQIRVYRVMVMVMVMVIMIPE